MIKCPILQVSRFRRLYRLAASSKKSNIRRLKKDLEGQVEPGPFIHVGPLWFWVAIKMFWNSGEVHGTFECPYTTKMVSKVGFYLII